MSIIMHAKLALNNVASDSVTCRLECQKRYGPMCRPKLITFDNIVRGEGFERQATVNFTVLTRLSPLRSTAAKQAYNLTSIYSAYYRQFELKTE